MPIVLHRFPLSHFSEKGRALLDFKKLEFRIEEHQLGLPQLGIYRLSGQRQVPVIEDAGRIVSDSTEIALYLEDRHREPRLLPEDPGERREVLALEDRLDHWMGSYAPVVWFDWLERDRPEELRRLFELEVWGLGRGRLAARAVHPLMKLGKARSIVRKSTERTRTLLGELCTRLGEHRYLCGDVPTLADVAAVGLAFHLEIPKTRHLAIPDWEGLGVPGFADAPEFARFFEWRRQFYAEHLG
ncbi:MAG: glutathione S-transferase family protein [Polyangiaceae bacterium]|nr:glutathione S-transferase family protein [Polyangiaceae bacterium]